jgi:hypothetical protein
MLYLFEYIHASRSYAKELVVLSLLISEFYMRTSTFGMYFVNKQERLLGVEAREHNLSKTWTAGTLQ